MSRIPWNELETALLIDAYIGVRDGIVSSELAVSRLSFLLREYGKARGIEVDDVFRNFNGISMRMSEIQNLFNGGQGGLRNTSKLFIEMVEMYKTNRKRFNSILAEAKGVTNLVRSYKTSFHEWLNVQSELVAPVRLLVAALEEGSNYALNRGIIKTSIWNMDDEQEITGAFQKVLAPYSWFRMTHRKRRVNELESALVYYQRFLREHQQSVVSHQQPVVSKEQGETPHDTETIEMHQNNGDNNESVVKSVIGIDNSGSNESTEKPDQTGSFIEEQPDEEQSHPEDEEEQVINDHQQNSNDEEVRHKNPELYDLVFSVLLKLQKEQKEGATFIEIYEQIGNSFTEIKRILYTSCLVEQRGKRFLIKPEAMMQQRPVSIKHNNEEKEPVQDTKVTEDKEIVICEAEVSTEDSAPTEEINEDDSKTIPSTAESVAEEGKDDSSEKQNKEHDEGLLFEDDVDGQMPLMDLEDTEEDATLEDENGLADRLYVLLKSISDKNKYGTTLYYLATTVRAPQAFVKAILDGANWAKCEYNRYKFNFDAIENVMEYDFIKPQSLAYTKPLSLTYFEETVLKPSSWRQLFLEFMRLINEDYPHYVNDLKGIVFSGASLPIIADKGTAKQMREPKEFADGLFIETNRSANDLMANMRRILDACYVDYENVVIRYTAKSTEMNGTGVVLSYESVIDKKSKSITIGDAIRYVLSNAFEPLTIQEIYDQIEYDTAYHFTAKDPLHYLRTQIEMHCQGSGYVEQTGQATIGIIDINGEKKYYLLSKGELIIQRVKSGLQDRKKEQEESAIDIQSKIDSFLVKKYPILFTRVYYALKEYGRNGTTIHSLMSRVGKVARASTIKQILEYASWSKKIDDEKYQFSSTPVIHNAPKDLLESQTVVIEKKAKQEKPSGQRSAAPLQKAVTDASSESTKAHVTADGFFNYLRYGAQLAEGTCKGYVSAIRTAEGFAIQQGIEPHQIFDAELATAETVVQILMANSDFVEFDRRHQHYFRAALAKLTAYIQSRMGSRNEQGQDRQESKANQIHGSAYAIVTEEGFFNYMLNVKRMAKNTCTASVSAVRTSQKHAFQRGLSPWKIFGADSSTAITVVQALMQDKSFIALNRTQNNRFIIALEKLKDYIGAELSDDKGTPPPAAEPKKDNESTSMPTFDKERYIKVLMQRYRNGMMFDSIDYDNFRDTYEMLFDETLDVEDAVLEKQLRACGVVYMDRLFPAEGIIDNQTREKLYQYIENSFSSGKQVLYYKAIFADLASDFVNCYVLRDADMLRAYLEFTAEPGQYFFFEDYMAKERSVKIDHNAEIADRLLTEGKPMKIDDLCAALSHIPSDQIRRIITTDKQFVWNAKGEYFHRDIFEVTGEELEKIAGIIDHYIAENGYAIWTDIWLDIQAQMPAFLENNLYLSSYGVREILARRLSRKFSFNAAVISLPQDNLQMWKVYQLFAKHHPTFTADELSNLIDELGANIYFESIFEVSVRVSRDLFVSKKQIIFDVAEIDKAIESFMSKDYIKIREIDSFLAFPYVGFEWNEYLLESFLISYSKRFILLNNGFSLNNVAGAVVKKNSAIKDFVDVCAAVLADSPVSLKKNEALDYLVETNMITRRSYRYIEEALRKAAQIRGAKG